MGDNQSEAVSSSNPATSVIHNQEILNKLDLPPATLEALKTLSTITSADGVDKLTDCDRLTASLEQIRAKKNMKLFEKLDKIRQDFSGLNNKIAKIEESILDLKEFELSRLWCVEIARSSRGFYSAVRAM